MAVNVAGVVVARELKRPVMSMIHAGGSLGGLTVAGGAAAAAAAGRAPRWHPQAAGALSARPAPRRSPTSLVAVAAAVAVIVPGTLLAGRLAAIPARRPARRRGAPVPALAR